MLNNFGTESILIFQSKDKLMRYHLDLGNEYYIFFIIYILLVFSYTWYKITKKKRKKKTNDYTVQEMSLFFLNF